MINKIDKLIDTLNYRNNLPFLSNENNSWTYSELSKAIKFCKSQIENKPKSTCMILGDYTLKSVAWMITGLLFGWRVVPVVSDNRAIIEQRKNISKATFQVSVNSQWNLEKITSKNKIKSFFEESGVVLFSSGSTGEPKAMCKDIIYILNDCEKSKSKPISMSLLLLFDHIGGLNTLFSGIKKSYHMVAPTLRKPKIMAELIEKYSVRILPCSPTFLNMMDIDRVFDDYKLKSLKLITYGTERMPEELLKRISEKLPHAKFLQTFGTSETGIVKTKSFSSSSTYFTIDDPNTKWKIVNNELWINSNNQILSYINTDEKAINDGWFKTGDLVEAKNENFFKIVGRKNEVINVGGQKVLPAEIENFVMSIEGVIDCTAYAVENSLTGQAVGITVVTEDKDTKKLKSEIRSLSNAKLESFKLPVKIVFETKLSHTERFKKERKKK